MHAANTERIGRAARVRDSIAVLAAQETMCRAQFPIIIRRRLEKRRLKRVDKQREGERGEVSLFKSNGIETIELSE